MKPCESQNRRISETIFERVNEDLANVGIHDEIDVALAVTFLDVDEPVEFIGQRHHRLGKHGERRHA